LSVHIDIHRQILNVLDGSNLFPLFQPVKFGILTH
jgi:hypothetical protein